MDIENKILTLRSKEQVAMLVRWVEKDKGRFGKLMNIFLKGEEEPAKKAAWVIGHCAEKYPELARSWLKPMIKKIKEPGVHAALKRNVVRILQFAEIPRPLQGEVANLCFAMISSLNEPIAVRTFSMTVISRIAQNEPALQKELEDVIMQTLPYSTGAFKSRARMVLKERKSKKPIEESYEDWLKERESE